MLSYLLLIIPNVIAALSLAKDWKAHSSHWRRGLVIAGIAALLLLGIINLHVTNKQHIIDKQESQADRTKLNGDIDNLKQRLKDNRQQVDDLQQKNDKANATITDKESLIEGLARTLMGQSKMLQSSVMGEGYALVEPSMITWGDPTHLRFIVFSNSKQHLYDVQFAVTEAIYPNDSAEVAMGKIHHTFSCNVPNLNPISFEETKCQIDIPPNGIKFFIKVSDKRGPMLTEQYEFGPMLNGKQDSKLTLYGPTGKPMAVSDVTGIKIKPAS